MLDRLRYCLRGDFFASRLMKARKLHRIIGLVMLLPLLGWAVTGLVFFLKPGYEGAYELLPPKTYPLNESLTIKPDPTWLECRYFRTILGNHLLVRTAPGWQHLDPLTLAVRKNPTTDEIKLLLTDAFAINPSRYGQITEIANNAVTTSTQVHVSLDWKRLSLQQRGRDTDRIDGLYKLHYLQWTGVKTLDQVIGFVGLALLVMLSGLGLLLQFNFRIRK